jgi:hypothetical protein
MKLIQAALQIGIILPESIPATAFRDRIPSFQRKLAMLPKVFSYFLRLNNRNPTDAVIAATIIPISIR